MLSAGGINVASLIHEQIYDILNFTQSGMVQSCKALFISVVDIDSQSDQIHHARPQTSLAALRKASFLP